MANSSVMVVCSCTTELKDITRMVCDALPEIDAQWKNFQYDARADILSVDFKFKAENGTVEDRCLHIHLHVNHNEYTSDNVPNGPKVLFSFNVWGSSVLLIDRLAAVFSQVYSEIHVAADDGGDFHRYVRAKVAA